jgi:hypothetical protein
MSARANVVRNTNIFITIIIINEAIMIQCFEV